MPALTMMQKHSIAERLRGSIPVNKQAALVVSRATGWWNQIRSPDALDYMSKRGQVFECPRLAPIPSGCGEYVGRRNGSVQVVGVADARDMRRLGWTRGSVVVRCDCGRFENRTWRHIRKPSNKEYVDACTVCRGIWADHVKSEHAKTGKWPGNGGPTHRASQFMLDGSRKQE